MDVEIVNTEGGRYHGMGWPFIWDLLQDKLYIGTTETFHMDLIEESEAINLELYHGEEDENGEWVQRYVGGRYDPENLHEQFYFYGGFNSDFPAGWKERIMDTFFSAFPEAGEFMYLDENAELQKVAEDQSWNYLGIFVYIHGEGIYIDTENGYTHYDLIHQSQTGENSSWENIFPGWIFVNKKLGTFAVPASVEYSGNPQLRDEAMGALKEKIPGIRFTTAQPGMFQWDEEQEVDEFGKIRIYGLPAEDNQWFSKKGVQFPAQYRDDDPLDIEGKKPLIEAMNTEWWTLDKQEQKQAIINAFRATMLSPRMNLKSNAILYQTLMHIPADESNPDVFEQAVRAAKAKWDAQGQMGLEQNPEDVFAVDEILPGKFMPGFWGNIRRLANLGPYAEVLWQIANKDMENGGTGEIFRNEILELGVPGVQAKVASFAWLALAPMTSELATVDVHMMRHLEQEADSPNSVAEYLELEQRLKVERDQMYGPEVPLSWYQWGVWDKRRTPGYHQDHTPLRAYNPVDFREVAWPTPARPTRPKKPRVMQPGQLTFGKEATYDDFNWVGTNNPSTGYYKFMRDADDTVYVWDIVPDPDENGWGLDYDGMPSHMMMVEELFPDIKPDLLDDWDYGWYSPNYKSSLRGDEELINAVGEFIERFKAMSMLSHEYKIGEEVRYHNDPKSIGVITDVKETTLGRIYITRWGDGDFSKEYEHSLLPLIRKVAAFWQVKEIDTSGQRAWSWRHDTGQRPIIADFKNQIVYIGNVNDHHLELQDAMAEQGYGLSNSIIGFDILSPLSKTLMWNLDPNEWIASKPWGEVKAAVEEYFNKPRITHVSKVSCHYADGRSADHWPHIVSEVDSVGQIIGMCEEHYGKLREGILGVTELWADE